MGEARVLVPFENSNRRYTEQTPSWKFYEFYESPEQSGKSTSSSIKSRVFVSVVGQNRNIFKLLPWT